MLQATPPDAAAPSAASVPAADTPQALAATAFRAAEKRYQLHYQEQQRKHRSGRRMRGGKLVRQPTDLSAVIDMRDPASTSSAGITALALQLSSDCGNVQLAPGSVTALLFSAHPGLVVFPAAVPPQQQLQLMRAALTEWPGPPARTNHSAAYGDSIPAGLFDAAQAGLRLLTHQPTTPPGCAAGGMRQQQEEQEQQQHVGGGTEQQDPYQQHTPQQRQTGAASGQPRTWAAGGSGPLAASLLRKLRWVCLGPPYDWTQRRYEPQLPHRPLAPLLAAMARSFAAAAATALQRPAAAAGAPSQQPGAGREQQPACACCHSSSRAAPFTPDAALVNYYHAGDTLNGHKDDVEVDLSQPIVTHSLGCDAVFLMGGPTRDVAPTALLLRSGDVVVLAKEARACFHGVPRVLTERPLPAEVLRAAADAAAAAADDGLRAVVQHMQQSRVSISVRCTV